jgi:outer membrane protein assembly factor BamB
VRGRVDLAARAHARARVYGGLDGRLHVVPLAGGEAASYPTAFGAPISAPLAVAGGRVYVGSEDGYLYVFGAGGQAALPTNRSGSKDPQPADRPAGRPGVRLVHELRRLQLDQRERSGARSAAADALGAAAGRDGQAHAGVRRRADVHCTRPKGRSSRWSRIPAGCSGGGTRPDVYLSFTSPLYVDGKLLVPQAGMRQSMVRCLDAATGELLWEAPFTGSPSWSRQFPPLVHGNVAIYASGSGEYAAAGKRKAVHLRGDPEPAPDGREVMSFIYSNDNPYYPRDNRPLLWAWDLETGELVWQRDFSEYGRGGNDCGICLYDGKLYYSTFFGYSASQRARRGLPPENNGLTACLDPATGEVIWLTTDYFVTAKCTVTGATAASTSAATTGRRRTPTTASSGASTPATARSSGSPTRSPRP